ncbi:MAG TPA: hypothetical protein VGR06_18050 [Actinophytocola sp.]|jgi:hypothetical protein|uniref:hypothetical protein n=1 Tax=Actinophytocola sp. TaxID=1872138 RepID=UPI002E084C6F|nr:hypothetical protein [Actinophytocola sp.]
MTRFRWLVLLAVVTIAAVIFVLADGMLPWGTGSSSGRCDVPDSVSGPQGTSAPDGGSVRVLEQGFTQDADGAVNMGALLENTSGDVAYRTLVTFRLFDPAHTELPESAGTPLRVEIPIVLPGQRIGTGSATYRSSVRVSSFEINLDRTAWVPRDSFGQGFAPVTGTYLRTARFQPRIPASVDIHYKETSANCRGLESRTTAVVFRNSAGKIVGGNVASPDVPIVFRDEQGNDLGGDWQRPPTPSCSRGERETWIVPSAGQPSTADDAHTEIYPYCDLRGP